MRRAKTREFPVAECKRCRRRLKIVSLERMICQTCHKHEPKAICGVCSLEKRFLTKGAGVCPDCVKKARRCTEVECARCGRTKPLAKLGGEYCKPCQTKVNRGEGRCSGCGRDKQYVLKKAKLCNRCYTIGYAPRGLQKNLETVSISNEYNRTLFNHLAGLIDWETADEEARRRFRDFGKFLQTYRFDGPLTWGSILKLKSELPGARFVYVRHCLHQLGELLLDPSKDETLEECKRRIRPLVSISSLEADVIAVFEKYDLWLRTERKNTPSVRRGHFATLGGFWRWCARRGLTSLAMVEAAHVEEYLYTLGLKWTCRHCSFTKNLTARGEPPPTACENLECRALHSSEKMIRCLARTVDGNRGRLQVFFGWLKDVEEGIEMNPAPTPHRRKRGKTKRWKRTRKYTQTIQYYDWVVIDALLKAIEDPKMPAEEAMALYLLLHHAFYLRELQTVRIPSHCRPIALGVESRESLADVLSLEWKPRELSRGRQFLGRTGAILRLEPADEPWLGDLVRRFMRERNQKLRDPTNPYLFVGTGQSPRGGPVGYRHFSPLIESATARVTGRVCTVDILGKCSRVIYAEFGGHEGFRHLHELGLGAKYALSYAWAKPVRVVPKEVEAGRTKQRRSSLTVPPIDVFGIPTYFGRELRKD